MNRVNLHIHSIASDGILSGIEIVNRAEQENIKIISITDHDSVNEVQNAIDKAKKTNVMVIPGVELTAEYQNGECHILGYGISLEIIERFSKKIRENRIAKAKKIIKLLNYSGYDITYDEVLRISSSGVISRRNIARVLVKHNYFEDENIAIKSLLDKGAPFYVETRKNKIEDCVAIIKESGGYSVIAHPWTLNLTISQLEEFIKKYNIEGIEVFNRNIPDSLFNQLNMLADNLNLYKTCGTDYHGQKGLDDFIVNKDVDCSKILKKIRGEK